MNALGERAAKLQQNHRRGSLLARTIAYINAVGKVGIAGAGVSLAGMGLLNLTHFVVAHDWPNIFETKDIAAFIATVGGLAAATSAAVFWWVRDHRDDGG